MTDHDSDVWSSLLRMHRHDLMNGLQLVTGYLQLNKPDRALQSVERIANWLRTISWIQTVTEETADKAWLKASHTAPHVLLSERPNDLTYTAALDEALAATWQWLEETAALYGIPEMRLVIVGKTRLGQSGIKVLMDMDEDEPPWWTSRPELALIEWIWEQIDGK